MSQLFQHKYRIASARLQCWDYRWAAAYFITICTHNRACCLGQVTEGCMQLSPVGVMADVFWHEIKNHVAHVQLDAFVVMPNPVHGILILNECGDDDVDTVETGHALSLPKTIGQSRYQHIGHRSVSSIIGSYKSAVTKHAHRLGYHFGWQTRYWDHIIRDQPSFQRIQTYIVNNPAKWGDDRFHR